MTCTPDRVAIVFRFSIDRAGRRPDGCVDDAGQAVLLRRHQLVDNEIEIFVFRGRPPPRRGLPGRTAVEAAHEVLVHERGTPAESIRRHVLQYRPDDRAALYSCHRRCRRRERGGTNFPAQGGQPDAQPEEADRLPASQLCSSTLLHRHLTGFMIHDS